MNTLVHPRPLLRRILQLLVLVTGTLALAAWLALAPAAAAYADTVDPTPGTVSLAGVDWIFGANLLVSMVLPAVVGFVTSSLTESRTKVVLLAALNLLAAALGELVRTVSDGGTYDVGPAIMTFVAGLIVSWLTYNNGWKKAGITSATVGRQAEHRASE